MTADPLIILMIPPIPLLGGLFYMLWKDRRDATREERLQVPFFKPHTDFTYGQNGRRRQRR
jgi:hypothetical protein